MAAGSRLGRALRRVSGSGAAKKVSAAAKAPAKKATAKKTTAKKTTAKKTTAKKTTAKKTTAKKTTAKKTTAKKAPATKPATKKTPAKKAIAKKTSAGRAPAAIAAKKSPATKPAAKKAPVTKAPAANVPSKKVAVKNGPAKTTTQHASAAPSAPAPDAAAISVPEGSEWTEAELAAVRRDLLAQLGEMRAAYEVSIRDLNDLQQAGTDGAGDDQADAGSKTFEREQEQSIAANRLDLMTQIQHAIERIDRGTYGFCESCGRPIPKARLKAFPSATLDVACKQREERR